MGNVAFTYQCTHAGANMTLFTEEDIGSEDYSLLEQRVSAFSSLYLAFTHRIHPRGHKETKDEILTRESFYPERFALVAAEFNNEGVTGYASAFLVNKYNPKVAYVMELTGFQITDCVYGEWEIKDDDGDLFSLKEMLGYFGIPEEGLKDVVPAPVKRKEEELPPAFTPTKKKTIQNLGNALYVEEENEDEDDDEVPLINVPRSVFIANSSKKPGKIRLNSDLPRQKAPAIEEEEEEDATPVEVTRMEFVANSSKKPGKIHLQSDKKPKPVNPVPKDEPVSIDAHRMDFVANSAKKPSKIRLDSDAKKKKVVVAPKEDPVHPSVSITPDFTPTKKGGVGAIVQNEFKAEPELFFPMGPKNPNARLFVYFPDDSYVRGIFEEAGKRVKNRKSLSVKEDCLFAPEISNDESWKKPLNAFDLSSWRILALTLDLNDAPLSYLLGHASIKGLALILDEKGMVQGVSRQGIDIRRPHFAYADLLASYGIKGE